MKKATLYILLFLISLLALWALWTWNEVGNYPDKLWLHRCNSILKYEEQKSLYPHVELDLVVRENGVMDITHDTHTTYGLPLDSFFSHLSTHKAKSRLWLDVKNLNAENQAFFAQQIDSLCHAHHINRDRLIIESRDTAALRPLTAHGFYTSYYVSFSKPSRLNDAAVDSCLHLLQDICDSHSVCALSFPGWWYGPIKKGPNRSIDLLSWEHRTTQWEFLFLPYHRKMLHDPQLKVILLKSKGKHHR